MHIFQNFPVKALSQGGQGPIVRFLLEQTINSLGSIEFSQAWHLKGTGVVILGPQTELIEIMLVFVQVS